MAFNGSGTYNLPAGNPVVTGTTISSTTTNTTNSDIATALTNCITRDGQSTPSANLPMNAKKLTGLAAGTSAGDSVRYEQVVLTGAALGTPTSGTLTSCTGLPLTTGVTGTLPVANGGTGVTTSTGSGNNVLSTSPTLTTPVLGTPSSGDLSSCTNAVGYGLKSATTTVSVSAATAPSTGQVLTATSSTAATWQTPGGSSAMVFLSTVTASAVATADIETTFDSTYDTYLLVGSGITVSSNGTAIECRMKIGGAYVTSGTYDYHLGLSQSSADTYLGSSGSAATTMYIVPGIYNASGAGADFSMYIYNPSSTALQKFITSVGVCRTNSTTLRQAIFCGANSGTAALTGIRLFVSTGTLSGTFRLYGIAKS